MTADRPGATSDRRNPEPIAPDATKLVILRGNSGSGKSSIAREVRARYGRGCALVEQDYLRRVVLREWDGGAAGGIAPQLIGNTARFLRTHPASRTPTLRTRPGQPNSVARTSDAG
jgi:alpha-D-ribose 1-methylphosphonate 5-triphosphate synthase subunit PhnL